MFFTIVIHNIYDMKIMIIQYVSEYDFLGIKTVFRVLMSTCLPVPETVLKKDTKKTLKPATNKDLNLPKSMWYLILPQRYGSGGNFKSAFYALTLNAQSQTLMLF